MSLFVGDDWAFQKLYHAESASWKRLQQPSSHASKLLTTVFRAFNTHNKCTECAVSSVGFLWVRSPCRGLVEFLWGSQKALTWLVGSKVASRYSNFWVPAITLPVT